MFLSWRGISKYHSISRDSGGNVQLLSFVLQTSPERVTVSIRAYGLYPVSPIRMCILWLLARV